MGFAGISGRLRPSKPVRRGVGLLLGGRGCWLRRCCSGIAVGSCRFRDLAMLTATGLGGWGIVVFVVVFGRPGRCFVSRRHRHYHFRHHFRAHSVAPRSQGRSWPENCILPLAFCSDDIAVLGDCTIYTPPKNNSQSINSAKEYSNGRKIPTLTRLLLQLVHPFRVLVWNFLEVPMSTEDKTGL